MQSLLVEDCDFPGTLVFVSQERRSFLLRICAVHICAREGRSQAGSKVTNLELKQAEPLDYYSSRNEYW